MKTKLEEILGVTNLTKEDEFIKLYLNDLGKLCDLSKPTLKLFTAIIKFVEYNPQNSIHNVISLSRDKRKKLIEETGWNIKSGPSQLSQSLVELTLKEVLIKIGADTYLLNPSIASKANWADVKLLRTIKLNITYEKAQRTLVTLIEELPDTNKEKLKELLES